MTDGGAFHRVAMKRDVLDFKAYRIAIAKLAVDGEVEERQVAHLALHVQLRADRPDMFRGGFGPTSLPLFHGGRAAGVAFML